MIYRSVIRFTLAVIVTLAAPTALAQDYCDEGEGATTILLVDRTSTFDEQDKSLFAEGVGRLYQQIATGERLAVYTITEDYAGSRKIFDACRPGCREQGLIDGLFSQCRESVARVDDRRFQADFLASLKPLIDSDEQHPHSEIIETVAFVANEHARSTPRRLVIFSDLIEYSGLARFNRLDETEIEPLLARLTDLDLIKPLPGTAVDVYGFGRDHAGVRSGMKPAARRNIEVFWRDYFTRAGVVRVRIGRDL